MTEHSQTMTASEFKAKCLEIFDRLVSHELERVIITKHGRVVGVLTPPQSGTSDSAALFGSMRDSVLVSVGVDLTAPALDEPFDAEQGHLHR